MGRINQTKIVSEFILLGLSPWPEDQKLFLTIYLVTLAGNLFIILVICYDPHLQTPMYFFLSFLSLTDICFTTTIVPKMLVNFLSGKTTISFAGCLTQMYFLYALGNSDSCLLAVMAFDLPVITVAICNPFHYITIMNHHRCVLLVTFSCSFLHLHSFLHILLLNLLTFCGSSVIDHFLCDLSPLIKLSCSFTFVNEIVIVTEGALVLVTLFLYIAFSYIRILITVLKIPFASGKHKAFSTCGSHLTVVTRFYGSIFYVYLQPVSTFTVKDHVATIVYTVLSSMLNPFIYSLRNKDLKQGLRKHISRRSI